VGWDARFSSGCVDERRGCAGAVRLLDVDRALHVLGGIGDAGAAELVGGVRRVRRDDVERGALTRLQPDLVMHDPAGIGRLHPRIFEEAVGGEIVAPVRPVVEPQDIGAPALHRDAVRDEAIVGDGDIERRALVPVLGWGGGGDDGEGGESCDDDDFHTGELSTR
jgi:hypothetical protein